MEPHHDIPLPFRATRRVSGLRSPTCTVSLIFLEKSGYWEERLISFALLHGVGGVLSTLQTRLEISWFPCLGSCRIQHRQGSRISDLGFPGFLFVDGRCRLGLRPQMAQAKITSTADPTHARPCMRNSKDKEKRTTVDQRQFVLLGRYICYPRLWTPSTWFTCAKL